MSTTGVRFAAHLLVIGVGIQAPLNHGPATLAAQTQDAVRTFSFDSRYVVRTCSESMSLTCPRFPLS